MVEKLKEAISRLDAAAITSLLSHVQEELPKGYLLYQLGLAYSAEETDFTNRSIFFATAQCWAF